MIGDTSIVPVSSPRTIKIPTSPSLRAMDLRPKGRWKGINPIKEAETVDLLAITLRLSGKMKVHVNLTKITDWV